jgi:uncharacterized C2H2 Zn-finger protein
MVEYRCVKCEKIFKKKSDYINHQNRKTPCEQNEGKMDSRVCVYCGVKYTTKGSVTRHIKMGCSVLKTREDEKKEIYEELLRLKKENERIVEEMNKMKICKNEKQNGANIMNVNNGNINNGNINNVTIVAFGTERIEAIDTNSILSAMTAGFNATVKLTKNIHFNPNNPEYHNVYIPSMNNKNAMVYDGKRWALVPRDEIIDDLYREKKDYVEVNFEEFCKSLSETQIGSIKRWLAIDNEDNVIIKMIKRRIELLLYNERNIPKETHKQ